MTRCQETPDPQKEAALHKLREELRDIRDRTPEERKKREREFWAEEASLFKAEADVLPVWLECREMTSDTLLDYAQQWLGDLVQVGSYVPLETNMPARFDEATDVIVAAALTRGFREQAVAIRKFWLTGEGQSDALAGVLTLQDAFQSEIAHRLSGKIVASSKQPKRSFEKIVAGCGQRQGTLEELAEVLRISTRTLQRWRKNFKVKQRLP